MQIMTESGVTNSSVIMRICCCAGSTSNEPPVQLVKSESITNPTKWNAHSSSPKKSIDGFEDISLVGVNEEVKESDTRTVDAVQPRIVVERMSDNFNMNDIMMDEICADDDKTDDVEEVIEDVISIQTNVVEEVDESELTDIQFSLDDRNKNSENSDDGKKAHIVEVIESTDTQDNQDRSSELIKYNIEFEDLRINDKIAEKDSKTANNSEEEDGKNKDSTRDGIDGRLEVELNNFSPTLESIQDNKETDSDSLTELTADVLSEDCIPPPPTNPSMSIMYADTTSDEDSDEEEREIMPPVQRPQKSMQAEEVPTVSLEENGKAEITINTDRITLGAGEITTDDEFSEKLI